MNIDALLNRFNKFCAEKGFVPKVPIGLLSPIFPHEFNVSAGHNYAMEILCDPNPIEHLLKYSLFEKSFRRIDLERIGYSLHHLSFFEAALFAYAGKKDVVHAILGESIKGMTYFLTRELEIPIDKMVITYFDGGRIRNFNISGEPFLEHWLNAGFISRQLVPIRGRRNLVFSESEGAGVCPTCEIFFDKGEIYESSSRYVEIGSVNIYKYIFNQRENRLDVAENWVLNSIVGVERILMVKQRTATIFDIDCIIPMVKAIENVFNSDLEKNLYSPSVRIIADSLRAITFICADGVVVNSTSQGKILKKLLKQLVSQMRYLQIFDTLLIDESIQHIVNAYNQLYPDLTKTRSKVVGLIASELENREAAHQ
jgi:alanyl-tRNA synthetase